MEAVQDSSADSRSVARQKPAALKAQGRSRVSNGRKTLPEADGRLKIARRFRDIASAILADQSGADQCSESRKQLIRRFAAAAVLAEQMESRLARGEEIDITEHALPISELIHHGAGHSPRYCI